MLDQQGQLDNLAYSTWDLEVAFNVNEREAVTAPGNEFGIIEAELLPVPIFDQPVEHIEVVREVDDTGRIAVRKTNCNAARKRAAWRHKTIFGQCYVPNPARCATSVQRAISLRKNAANSSGPPSSGS